LVDLFELKKLKERGFKCKRKEREPVENEQCTTIWPEDDI
jgi:hypothetical protein